MDNAAAGSMTRGAACAALQTRYGHFAAVLSVVNEGRGDAARTMRRRKHRSDDPGVIITMTRSDDPGLIIIMTRSGKTQF
jgi:hypothetical protein